MSALSLGLVGCVSVYAIFYCSTMSRFYSDSIHHDLRRVRLVPGWVTFASSIRVRTNLAFNQPTQPGYPSRVDRIVVVTSTIMEVFYCIGPISVRLPVF